MPAAPDYETIFNLEDAIEDAAQTVLKAAPYSVPHVFTQRESGDLPPERIDVQLRVTSHQGHKSILRDGSGYFVRSAWNGTLTFSIFTKRERGSETMTHGKMRGRVRLACEYFKDAFNEEILPYHALTSIVHQDTDPQINVEDELDVSALHFAVVIGVRTGAWPGS